MFDSCLSATIFTANPSIGKLRLPCPACLSASPHPPPSTQRITMAEIKQHEWFLKNLPADLIAENDPSYQYDDPHHPPQSIEEIMRILQEARVAGSGAARGQYTDAEREDDELMETEGEAEELESSGEFVCAM